MIIPGRLKWMPTLGSSALQFQTIRSRIYVTLVAIVVLTLVVVGLISFLLLGGYQDRVDESRLRELATAWGPELFSEEGEARNLDQLLQNWAVAPTLTGSLVGDLDVPVLGLTSSGEVVRAMEAGERFHGETLPIDLGQLDRTRVAQGQVTTDDGERLTYVVTSLPPEEQQRQGLCCIAVALVGESRSAILGDLAPRLCWPEASRWWWRRWWGSWSRVRSIGRSNG